MCAMWYVLSFSKDRCRVLQKEMKGSRQGLCGVRCVLWCVRRGTKYEVGKA